MGCLRNDHFHIFDPFIEIVVVFEIQPQLTAERIQLDMFGVSIVVHRTFSDQSHTGQFIFRYWQWGTVFGWGGEVEKQGQIEK